MARKGEGWVEGLAGGRQFALAHQSWSFSTSDVALTCTMKLIVDSHLGRTSYPILGTLSSTTAPASPATNLGASDQPAAKPEDVTRTRA